MPDHTCPVCGAIFQRTRPKSNAIYCSDPCRLTSRRERDREARARYRERITAPKPEKKLRPCLACGEPFLTEIGIRICPVCKSDNGRRHRLSCYRILGPREAI